jgi:ferredoxin
MAANAAILCLGEEGDLEGSPLELKCEGGKIEADSWGRTSIPKAFAGGDVATGKGTVAHAIGSGRSAASAIAAFLMGESGPQEMVEKPLAGPSVMNFDYWEPSPRQMPGRIARNKAVSSFGEIHKTISKKGAALEAARCGRCGVRPEFQTDACRGCNNCSSRCPSYAIELRSLETPFRVKVDVEDAIRGKVDEICFKARINPESIVCFCTATRAMEIAASIVKGAKRPEDVSRMTGARTGCGVLCIQPIFRLLQAAGIELGEASQSDVWYPTVPTIWSVPEGVMEKYGDRGFRFDEDKLFYQKYLTRK